VADPTTLHDEPDEEDGRSSVSSVGLSGRLDKPDTARGLKDRIGMGLLLSASGSSGQVEGVRAYKVESPPLPRISP
jgi:hypothetical protein